MPSKHHRPALTQRRSASGSNTKLTLSGLNLQKLDTSTNLQLQVALNNATKDLPKGKAKKSGGQSNQPPSRTASDHQIRSPSKLHPQTQRPGTNSSTAAKPNKKPGFSLASPAVVAQEIEGGDDSDEWVSSESLSVTPQNQSSDSDSGDEGDDVVRNLPANLNLTATSPDDREPPTPTVPRVKTQPPPLVNNVIVREQQRHWLPTTTVRNEAAGTSPTGDGTDRHDKETTAVSAADDQEGVEKEEDGDDCSQSEHHARPEEGLASTPRPRALVDRDTEPSRHLLPAPLSDPPSGPDSTAREPLAVNHRPGGGVQDRPQQQQTLSAHSLPKSHPHITKDSPGPRTDSNPQGRDQNTMTQQQHQNQARPSTPKSLKQFPLSSPPSPTHRRNKPSGEFPQPGAVRQFKTRPSSLYSHPGKVDHHTVMARPHPLIRGPSSTASTPSNPNPISSGGSNGSAHHQNGVSTVAFGSGIGKLAPLTTITAVPSVSSSPSSSSPVNVKFKGNEEGQVKERLRRQSTASVSSVNTQRSLGRAAGYEYANQGTGPRNPRERTLSALPSAPYSPLSVLYPSYGQHGATSQCSPKSPGGPSHRSGHTHGFTSSFPPTEGDGGGLTASELMHMLLPAPYLSAHMTVLKGRSPIREAVERVSRAKKAQSPQ